VAVVVASLGPDDVAVLGVAIIDAAGLEKLIRGSVDDVVRASGMAGCDWSLGMPVGLMPIVGRLVTEVEALELLAGVTGTVIGRSGIDGAEGGVTLVVCGEGPKVRRAITAVFGVKGAGDERQCGQLARIP